MGLWCHDVSLVLPWNYHVSCDDIIMICPCFYYHCNKTYYHDLFQILP